MLNFHRHLILFLVLTLSVFSLRICQADETESRSKALAHYIMGVHEDLNGNPQAAILEYEKSVKFDHQQPMPHLRLASYNVRMGRLDDALKHLKIVIKNKPESISARYLLASIYSVQKNFSSAANEYETILKLASQNNPENFEVHAYLAQIYYSQRKYTQAIEQFNQILRFQPKNVSAAYLLGSIYMDMNQSEQAKEYFRQVLALEPDHDEALNSLAYTYAQEEINLDEALKMVRKAITLDPTSGAYYDTLGWVLFKQGFNAEGLMALEKAKSIVSDPVIYEHIGDVYKVINEPTLARKNWLKALSLNPHQPKLSQKIEELNKTSAQILDSHQFLIK